MARDSAKNDPPPSQMSVKMDILTLDLERSFQTTEGLILTHRQNSERISNLLRCIDFLEAYCQHVMEMSISLHKQTIELLLVFNSEINRGPEQQKRQRGEEVVANVGRPRWIPETIQARISFNTLMNPTSFTAISLGMACPVEVLEFESQSSELMLHTLKSNETVEPLCKRSQFWLNSLAHELMLSEFNEEDNNIPFLNGHLSHTDLDETLLPEVDSLSDVSDSIQRRDENQLEPEQTNTNNNVGENSNNVQQGSPVNDSTNANFDNLLAITDKENILATRTLTQMIKLKRGIKRKSNTQVLGDVQIDRNGRPINQQQLLDDVQIDRIGRLITQPQLLDIDGDFIDFDRRPSPPLMEMNDDRNVGDDESDTLLEDRSQFSSQVVIYEELNVRKHEITILEMFGTQPSELMDGEVSLDVTNKSTQRSRIGDDGSQILSFKDLVRGRSRTETCRLFTSTLFMATNKNIDITNVEFQADSQTPCPLTTDFELILVSNVLPSSEINARFGNSFQNLSQRSYAEGYSRLHSHITSTPNIFRPIESPMPSQSQFFDDSLSSIVDNVPGELNGFAENGSARGVRRKVTSSRMSTPSPTPSAKRFRKVNRSPSLMDSPGHPIHVSTPAKRRLPLPENGAELELGFHCSAPSTSRGLGAGRATPPCYFSSDDD